MKKQGIIIHPEELTEQMLELLKNTNINVLGLHPAGGRNAARNLENFLLLMETEEFQNKLQEVRKLGILIEYEMHVLSWLVPRELYTDVPEWFRMNQEGKRVNDYHVCVSNSEVLEYISKRTEELTKRLKSDTGRYYDWIDDIPNTFCYCEKCKEFTPSEQALMIYHAILTGIQRVDSQGKQCYLAYQDTMEVPKKIKPRSGIFLEYAPMNRNTKVPLDDKNCKENVKYYQKIEALLECFGKKDAQVLEYWLDNSLFSLWKKPPKYMEICQDTIRKDIWLYRSLGMEDITTFACFLSDEYIELYGKPPIREYAECFSE